MQVNPINSVSYINRSSSASAESVIIQPQKADRNFLDLIAEYKKILLNKAKKIMLTDEFGLQHQALLVSTNANSKYIELDGKVQGVMAYSFSKAPIKGDNYPDEYKNKEYLFINSIYSNKKYKNVGTQLIKAAVKESQKQGCDGRVCLNTSTTKPELGSPVPFYYKIGFEASSIDIQKKIEEKMMLKQELLPECQAITMFLPMDVVNKIL